MTRNESLCESLKKNRGTAERAHHRHPHYKPAESEEIAYAKQELAREAKDQPKKGKSKCNAKGKASTEQKPVAELRSDAETARETHNTALSVLARSQEQLQGIEQALQDSISKHYRKQSVLYHPDKCKKEDMGRFEVIKLCAEILGDKTLRQKYLKEMHEVTTSYIFSFDEMGIHAICRSCDICRLLRGSR